MNFRHLRCKKSRKASIANFCVWSIRVPPLGLEIEAVCESFLKICHKVCEKNAKAMKNKIKEHRRRISGFLFQSLRFFDLSHKMINSATRTALEHWAGGTTKARASQLSAGKAHFTSRESLSAKSLSFFNEKIQRRGKRWIVYLKLSLKFKLTRNIAIQRFVCQKISFFVTTSISPSNFVSLAKMDPRVKPFRFPFLKIHDSRVPVLILSGFWRIESYWDSHTGAHKH